MISVTDGMRGNPDMLRQSRTATSERLPTSVAVHQTAGAKATSTIRRRALFSVSCHPSSAHVLR